MNLSTITSREAVQNWMNEKPQAVFRIKQSMGSRHGRPALGAWSNIRSAGEIPCGLRFVLERSTGENDVSKIFVNLEEDKPPEEQESTEVHQGAIVAQDKQELEQEFNRLSRSALTLSAAAQSVSSAASMAADAVVRSLEMQEKAQAQLEAATVGNAQAAFYQTLSYAVEQITSVARVYLAKDLPPDEKEAALNYAKMAGNLRRHGVDIARVKPADFAAYQSVSQIPAVRNLLDEIQKKNLQNIMLGATEIGEGAAGQAED